MRKRIVGSLLLLALVVPTTAASCGSEADSASPIAERIAEWIGLWKRDIGAGDTPSTRFRVPEPPSIAVSSLGALATSTRRDTATAAATLTQVRAVAYDESTQAAAEYTKELVCRWFAWWVEDPTRSVPDTETFAGMLLGSGLQVTFRTPLPQQVREASKLMHDAIARAEGDPDEAKRNAAVAAACSIPLPG